MTVAHESPIDHVDRVVQIYIEDGRLHLVYRFRCEERQVLFQLHQMDTDRDGTISESERDRYFNSVADELKKQLHVEVDGRALVWSLDAPVTLSPDLSQTYALSAPVGELAIGAHTGKFSDEYSRLHPGPYRWRPRQTNLNGIDVEATAAPGLENVGPHPAMIVVNLSITVSAKSAGAPATQPTSLAAPSPAKPSR